MVDPWRIAFGLVDENWPNPFQLEERVLMESNVVENISQNEKLTRTMTTMMNLTKVFSSDEHRVRCSVPRVDVSLGSTTDVDAAASCLRPRRRANVRSE